MLKLVELHLIHNLTLVTYVGMFIAECNNNILSINRSLIKKFSCQRLTKEQRNGEGMTVSGYPTVMMCFGKSDTRSHWQPTYLVISVWGVM